MPSVVLTFLYVDVSITACSTHTHTEPYVMLTFPYVDVSAAQQQPRQTTQQKLIRTDRTTMLAHTAHRQALALTHTRTSLAEHFTD